MDTAATEIIPNLLVRDGKGAVAFYQAAFGAVEEFRFDGDDGTIFAALRINGARLFVADESPEHENLSPDSLGGTSVRIDLLVPDPDAVFGQALRAGATQVSAGAR